MGKNNFSGTNCLEKSHRHDFDLNCKRSSYTRCHQHECCSHKGSSPQDHHHRCCCCHRSHCRKTLCDTDFSIRKGGLQDGLNYRLRQLLWCEAEFELDDGKTINGTIITVGSNFVEVLVKSRDQVDEKIAEASEEDLYKESLQKKKKPDEKREKRKHKKGRSWIFPTDKIANVKLKSSRHRECSNH